MAVSLSVNGRGSGADESPTPIATFIADSASQPIPVQGGLEKEAGVLATS